jgi:ATP-binding protein involved in chromosome partitioning
MPEQTETTARQAPVEGVARILGVASAKGGVGKSTVAVNLACALAAQGLRVGLADLDIYGPSAPILLGVSELPVPDEERRLMHPVQAHGLFVMSMGFFLDDTAPVVWRGPMAMSATRQFLRGVAWDRLDCLVVDLPPGTGDIPLTLAQEVPLDGVVIVTTPQDVAMADVERGVAMFRKLNTPIVGVVENMAGFVCPDCGTRDDIFGARPESELTARLGAPVLARLPLEPELRAASDSGTPLVLAEPGHPIAKAYADLAWVAWDRLDRIQESGRAPEPAAIRSDAEARSLAIMWSDGSETAYRWEGLRGWCPCAQCQGHSGNVRFVAGTGAALQRWEGVGRYAVRFLWEDGHSTGIYSYGFLREIADYEECRL